jgi:hypothetical protein
MLWGWHAIWQGLFALSACFTLIFLITCSEDFLNFSFSENFLEVLPGRVAAEDEAAWAVAALALALCSLLLFYFS